MSSMCHSLMHWKHTVAKATTAPAPLVPVITITGRLIMSKYVPESITADCRTVLYADERAMGPKHTEIRHY